MKVNVKFMERPEVTYALRRMSALLAIYAAASLLGILLRALAHAS
jgi:hypothetical protein